MKTLLPTLALTFSVIKTFALPYVQAEAYADMDGVQLENAGTTVGYIDENDWLLYQDLDFENGMASITIAAATPNGTGYIDLVLDSMDGTSIGHFYPEATGGWATFTDQTMNVTSTTGVHDLYLIARGSQGVCNLDYFSFSTVGIIEPIWVLDWSDEFDGTAVDESVWRIVDHGNPDNGELQFYTPRTENVEVSDGTLKLIARKESYTGQGPWMSEPQTRDYTSGKLETQSKKTFMYGKIEARMKLPRGKGTWPAFWMLGDNIFEPGVGWPRCGEIDIMEHGQDFDHLGAALHTGASNHNIGNQRTGTYHIDDYDTDFHTYGLIWSEDQLQMYVDDNIYFTAKKSELGDSQDEWPFDQPFYMILNHAVGGAWGGTPDDNLYPHTVEVDYVRVYKDIATSSSAVNTPVPIDIYPNPTHQEINIKGAEGQTFTLTDLQGRAVASGPLTLGQARVDVSGCDKGVYLLTVGGQAHKVVVE